jgi:hypothetical protein
MLTYITFSKYVYAHLRERERERAQVCLRQINIDNLKKYMFYSVFWGGGVKLGK